MRNVRAHDARPPLRQSSTPPHRATAARGPTASQVGRTQSETTRADPVGRPQARLPSGRTDRERCSAPLQASPARVPAGGGMTQLWSTFRLRPSLGLRPVRRGRAGARSGSQWPAAPHTTSIWTPPPACDRTKPIMCRATTNPRHRGRLLTNTPGQGQHGSVKFGSERDCREGAAHSTPSGPGRSPMAATALLAVMSAACCWTISAILIAELSCRVVRPRCSAP
jgi:hypothetical protein